ncbi:iron-containing alcohol dehydrogenase [Peribacillus cavernae]|uniref:Iron-containing alcohol dehydrogenase n=1 Tax=Peribacillus cavernae TaxID=1674310 RepID=A0A433HJN8_9BACI|nr:iron-containing alcohol dehydrogenase [Peribacillus cavernae]MDQ0219158.1 alcohol dehydrogenase class IV [Peribacillus cavernae]RUQ28614.1 iron-containing alcohol dehydrogenase [Peribacillus cavernae]
MNNLGFFKNPTQITYGMGAANQLREIIDAQGFKNVLIITDGGIVKTGLIDQLTRQLDGIHYAIFDETKPNPTVTNCDDAMLALKQINADVVVAMGGGSSIDVAKAVCLLATNGGSIAGYEGIDTCSNDLLPLVAIPTTAGTASEVTTFTVITDEERQYKLTVGGIRLAPKWALVDPLVTKSLPSHITASTGLDALVHALESYTSKMATPISKTLAREAIRKISSHLRQAVYNGDNMVARDNMLMGSLLAGLAFNNTRLGNCHALSHPVSAIYGVPHGVANSVLIPHVMEFNSLAVPELFSDIAEDMGENLESLTLMDRAVAAVDAVKKLSKDIGIPTTFAEFKVDDSQIDRMAKDAMLSGNIAANPRITTYEDVVALYRKSIGGALVEVV